MTGNINLCSEQYISMNNIPINKSMQSDDAKLDKGLAWYNES